MAFPRGRKPVRILLSASMIVGKKVLELGVPCWQKANLNLVLVCASRQPCDIGIEHLQGVSLCFFVWFPFRTRSIPKKDRRIW